MLQRRRTVGSADFHWDRDDAPIVIGGVLFVAVLLGAFAFMLDASALDVWTAIIVALVIIGGSVPIFRWVARKEGDPWLFKVLFAALLVHLAFAMVRFFMIFVVYGGSADAGIYHEAGVMFARRLRDGEAIHPIPIVNGFPVESQRIGDVTGVIYAITGPSVYAAFLVFAYICLWGQILIVRAFKAAVPEGEYRRFAVLVLFLPSLMFWPASIGKEALMIGCLGLIIYGGALLLAPKPRLIGAVYFVIGSLLVVLVRPHVAAMSIGALVVAMAVGVLSRSGSRAGTGRGRVLRLAGLAVLVCLAGFMSTRLSQQFDEYGDEGGTQSALDQTLDQTSLGNSEFVPSAITGPTRVPMGIVSVLFRPFPWEARNLNSLLAAAESLLLMTVLAVSWRRVASFPGMALKRPFLVFCAGYLLLFSIGFSFIGNFGILARQRVQVIPVVLVLAALPQWRSRRAKAEASPQWSWKVGASASGTGSVGG